MVFILRVNSVGFQIRTFRSQLGIYYRTHRHSYFHSTGSYFFSLGLSLSHIGRANRFLFSRTIWGRRLVLKIGSQFRRGARISHGTHPLITKGFCCPWWLKKLGAAIVLISTDGFLYAGFLCIALFSFSRSAINQSTDAHQNLPVQNSLLFSDFFAPNSFPNKFIVWSDFFFPTILFCERSSLSCVRKIKVSTEVWNQSLPFD